MDMKDTLLKDSFNREVTYLRLSLTDRCNYNCFYCKPEAGTIDYGDRKDILSLEEIYRLVGIMSFNGLRKVRLTGGEPLIRHGVEDLVSRLSKLKNINEVALTTNGHYLDEMAEPLKKAGLKSLNISLDSLNAERFKKITGGDLPEVINGIEKSIDAGFENIKINAVIMKGVNDFELGELIDFSLKRNLTIRFIEYMPLGGGNFNWSRFYMSVSDVLKKEEIKSRIDVSNIETAKNSAAFYLPTANGRGKIGFISPMSQRFCEGCNRVRLGVNGSLRACLPKDEEVDLLDLIRGGASDNEILNNINKALMAKPEYGVYEFDFNKRKKSMVQIGG